MTGYGGGDRLRRVEEALRDARRAQARAVHFADQATAWVRVRLSQLGCVFCYGDLSAPDGQYAATIGTGRCTCELACPRPGCQAGDGMELEP